jgi:SAM-dependent methyltransferase
VTAHSDLDDQRAYYDERWRCVTRANSLQMARAIAILEDLQAVEQRDPKILDIGCGTGWLSSILGRFGPTTGLDLSPVAIDRARRLYPDVEFIAGDLLSASLPPDAFDVVVAVQVIEHIEDQARFTDLVADTLRPAGHLLLVTDNPWNLARWHPVELERFAGAPQPVQRSLTGRALRTLLSPRFERVRWRTILPGYGHRGVLRAAHSVKLGNVLAAAGLYRAYQRLLLGAGFGLLTVAHARRPP